jgi:hypothetical protein
MKRSDYLTIEETASKLGRPASWVKEQICEGKFGASLAGRQWLIPSHEVDKLLPDNPLSNQPSRIVHNFQPDRPSRKAYNARNGEKASRPNSRNEATKRSTKPPPSAKDSPAKKWKDGRPTLTQKIKELDRKFERQSTELKAAMLEYRVAVESGKKAKPPRNLLRQWKSAKAELKHLVGKASSKGLVLPSGMHIYKVLAQEAESAKKTAVGAKVPRSKPATKAAGIGGYYGGPRRMNSQETQKLPAHVEARLMILRTKQRAAAHDMRDRGKSKAARDAAELNWARARQEAEKLEHQGMRSTPPAPASPGANVTPRPVVGTVRKTKKSYPEQIGRTPASGAANDTTPKPTYTLPLGNPASGIMLVVEQPCGVRVLEALTRSLRAVSLPNAYVTCTSTGLLKKELLRTEPHSLIAIGAGAARDIDAAGYPQTLETFSAAEPGLWFSWTKSTSGLLLPSLGPALDNDAAKRSFWRSFISLKVLAPTQ